MKFPPLTQLIVSRNLVCSFSYLEKKYYHSIIWNLVWNWETFRYMLFLKIWAILKGFIAGVIWKDLDEIWVKRIEISCMWIYTMCICRYHICVACMYIGVHTQKMIQDCLRDEVFENQIQKDDIYWALILDQTRQSTWYTWSHSIPTLYLWVSLYYPFYR